MTQRAIVTQALLTAIQAITFAAPINGHTAWQLTSTRLKMWNAVDPSLQPAAFLVSHSEMDAYRDLGTPRVRLEYRVFCYCRTDDVSISGSNYLDTMMDAFEAEFARPDRVSSGSNTLGGLVYWVRIEGRVFKDPGDIDSQALLIVPLIVEMP